MNRKQTNDFYTIQFIVIELLSIQTLMNSRFLISISLKYSPDDVADLQRKMITLFANSFFT